VEEGGEREGRLRDLDFVEIEILIERLCRYRQFLRGKEGNIAHPPTPSSPNRPSLASYAIPLPPPSSPPHLHSESL
jgi:hypothetical protein